MHPRASAQPRPMPHLVPPAAAPENLPAGPIPISRQPASPTAQGETKSPEQKLLRAMQLVKRARFNAHERLESKHFMSVAAFTFATVFEIALSLLNIVYSGKLAPGVGPFLDYASIVTALFLFGFGMVVGLADYQTRAVFLQRCAMDLANLAREMEIAAPLTTPELQEYRRRYHEIEARCPYNHSPVDLDRAMASRKDKAALRRANLAEAMDVYGPYALAAIAYLGLWGAFWLLLQ